MLIFFWILLLSILGAMLWFWNLYVFGGYIGGLIIGIISFLSVVRNFGKKAKRSVISAALFNAITKYRAPVYNVQIKQPEITQPKQNQIYEKSHDYAELVDILKKQMRFTPTIAKEASQYAIDNLGESPLEDKVKLALQFIDNGSKPIKGE